MRGRRRADGQALGPPVRPGRGLRTGRGVHRPRHPSCAPRRRRDRVVRWQARGDAARRLRRRRRGDPHPHDGRRLPHPDRRAGLRPGRVRVQARHLPRPRRPCRLRTVRGCQRGVDGRAVPDGHRAGPSAAPRGRAGAAQPGGDVRADDDERDPRHRAGLHRREDRRPRVHGRAVRHARRDGRGCCSRAGGHRGDRHRRRLPALPAASPLVRAVPRGVHAPAYPASRLCSTTAAGLQPRATSATCR